MRVMGWVRLSRLTEPVVQLSERHSQQRPMTGRWQKQKSLEIIFPQHEHKHIPAAGFQPGEKQVEGGGFQRVAVVAD